MINNINNITPYIMLGMGYTNNSIKGMSINNINEDNIITPINVEPSIEDYTTFTFQTGLGISYSINDNINIDIDYRYINYGKDDNNSFNDGTIYNSYNFKSKGSVIGVGMRMEM